MSFQKNAAAVGFFARAMKLATWLHGLPARLTPPPFRLMQISSAFWQSRALYVAARLDIAAALGEEALPAAAIARRVGAAPDATGRLLRLLAATGIFAETGPGVFRNNKVSVCLRDDHSQSVRSLILMHNSEFMSRPWFEALEAGVRQGQSPFQLTHGEDLFTYLDGHAEADALFSAAMDNVEALAGDSYVGDFAWEKFERLIDLGGSRGGKALAILRRHPHLRALVVDRPQVVAEARAHWARHPQEGCERLDFAAADLLAAIPPAAGPGDIYLLAAVLHGFGDEECLSLLRNLARALGDTGARAAVLEMVLPEQGADVAGAAFDLQMFMGTRGRERTLREWRALFDQSGLRLEEVVGLRGFANILVLRRPG